MNFFFSDILTLAVYSYSNELNNIARTLGRIFDGTGDNIEEKFIEGYKNYNSKELNRLLEKGMTKVLGSDAYGYELEQYLKKFGIEEDLSFKSDIEILKIVSKHKNEVKRILAQNGIV